MQNIDAPLDLLVIAPHPDDAEISVGGTIAKCRQQGMKVGVLELTNGEPTPYGSPETRREETDAATQVLDLSWRHQLELPNRKLENSLEARWEVAGVLRQTRPKILMVPYWEDAHPDHVSATQLAEAARFWMKLSRSDIPGEPCPPSRMLYYFSVHLRIHPSASFVFDISDVIEQKMDAVRCYKSQVLEGRSEEFPTVIDDVRDRARYWGWTIGTAFAEPFASREEIGLTSFDSLIVD